MRTMYLGSRAINQLNHDSIYDTARYRYFMEEDSVICLRSEYLDTAVSLSNKNSSNPNGWEQVEIRVKGAKKND